MNNTETIYKVGDRVWSPTYGWGEVISVESGLSFPVCVLFDCILEAKYYMQDGNEYKNCPVSLFFTEQQYIVERPKWQPQPGEWCWFWNEYASLAPCLGVFQSMFNEYFIEKNTQFNWQNCAPFTGELPPHLKGGVQ